LIQILSIKVSWAALAGFMQARGGGVNRAPGGGIRPIPDNAVLTFRKRWGMSGVFRFTAR